MIKVTGVTPRARRHVCMARSYMASRAMYDAAQMHMYKYTFMIKVTGVSAASRLAAMYA
jgi:hypothetical protein